MNISEETKKKVMAELGSKGGKNTAKTHKGEHSAWGKAGAIQRELNKRQKLLTGKLDKPAVAK